ncbi:SMC-Scp complex subunit ScpB [candidate division KSB1 bacterium]|nr:SMC-Scp complex subunit ScpB [candidate division KSB1 bacterium]
MHKDQLKQIIEAVIFASDSPLSLTQMKAIVLEAEEEEIKAALSQLSEELKDRSFFLKKVGGGYQFATRPEFWRWIKQMYAGKERSRLTRAALETLAIIAFRQPVSRVEVSAIRGVNVDGVVKNLLERNLISITGRDSGPGRALLFGTTPTFLQFFGINDLSDLPKPREIEELLAQGEAERIIQEISEEEILRQTLDEEAEEEVEASESKNRTSAQETEHDEVELEDASESGADSSAGDETNHAN